MARIIVNRRLRPIRFAFLIAPNNLGELHDVFRIDTVLWGGRHNAIVPAWTRRSKLHRGEGAGRDVVASFLDAFEPDYVVSRSVRPEDFSVPNERSIGLDEMLQ